MPFFRTSWGVGVLNLPIFNCFHNRDEFGTISEGLRNFGGGFEHPKSPLGRPPTEHKRVIHFRGNGLGKADHLRFTYGILIKILWLYFIHE